MKIICSTLRISIELNDWLKEQASKHDRSKNQEIVNIINLAKAKSDLNEIRAGMRMSIEERKKDE